MATETKAVVRLFLKRRPIDDTIIVPRAMIAAALKDPDAPAALHRMFGVLPVQDSAIHDKAHLESIVYWVPQGGLSAREDAQWIGLRARIAHLDDAREGPFTLSLGQAKLIWDRLNNAEFKIQRPSEQWSAFLQDYLLASGRHFADVTDDLFDDPDAEEAGAEKPE